MKKGVFDPYTIDLFGSKTDIEVAQDMTTPPVEQEAIAQMVMTALQGALIAFSPKAMLIPRYK